MDYIPIDGVTVVSNANTHRALRPDFVDAAGCDLCGNLHVRIVTTGKRKKATDEVVYVVSVYFKEPASAVIPILIWPEKVILHPDWKFYVGESEVLMVEPPQVHWAKATDLAEGRGGSIEGDVVRIFFPDSHSQDSPPVMVSVLLLKDRATGEANESRFVSQSHWEDTSYRTFDKQSVLSGLSHAGLLSSTQVSNLLNGKLADD